MPAGFEPPHPGGMAENSCYGEFPIRAIIVCHYGTITWTCFAGPFWEQILAAWDKNVLGRTRARDLGGSVSKPGLRDASYPGKIARRDPLPQRGYDRRAPQMDTTPLGLGPCGAVHPG